MNLRSGKTTTSLKPAKMAASQQQLADLQAQLEAQIQEQVEKKAEELAARKIEDAKKEILAQLSTERAKEEVQTQNGSDLDKVTEAVNKVSALSESRERNSFAAEIPHFSGKPDESAEEWLQVCEAVMDLIDLEENLRMARLLTALQGGARTWFLNQSDLVRRRWHHFAKAFQSKYILANRRDLVRSMRTLKQETGMSVEVYTRMMRKYLEVIKLDEFTSLELFKEGLKPELQKDLEIFNPTSLQAAIDRAMRVDKAEKLTQPPKRVFYSEAAYEQPWMQPVAAAPTPQGTHEQSWLNETATSTPHSMAIYQAGATQTYQGRRGSPRSTNQRRPGPLRCYNCYEEGHRATECMKPRLCHNCWQPGHLRRECPEPLNRRGPAAGGLPERQ